MTALVSPRGRTFSNGDSVLHVGRPNVGDRAVLDRRFAEVVDSGWFTNDGPMVREFEAALEQFTGARNVVTVSNATTGLQVAARALGIGPGDEVVMPSFTWIATAHAIEWIGAIPVFADVDPVTGHLDPDSVRRVVSRRTKAILGVHLYGDLCPVDELETLAGELGVPVYYDAAHSLGCEVGGRASGTFGQGEVFSFQATKFVNSFEGGAIATNDDQLADLCRSLRHQGLWPDRSHHYVGTVARMSEIHAAMGLTSLEAADQLIHINSRNLVAYETCLADVSGITVRWPARADKSNFQYVIVEVDPYEFRLDRDGLKDHLATRGVLSRPYFDTPCHEAPPYRDDPATFQRTSLTVSERLSRRVLALPSGSSVSPDDVELVCEFIREAGR